MQVDQNPMLQKWIEEEEHPLEREALEILEAWTDGTYQPIQNLAILDLIEMKLGNAAGMRLPEAENLENLQRIAAENPDKALEMFGEKGIGRTPGELERLRYGTLKQRLKVKAEIASNLMNLLADAKATPAQKELVSEFASLYRDIIIEELEARGDLEGYAAELYDALKTEQTDPDALTEDQLDLIENEFMPDFIETMIEEIEKSETLDAEDMELLDALKAVSPTEEPDTEEPDIEAVPDSVPIAATPAQKELISEFADIYRDIIIEELEKRGDLEGYAAELYDALKTEQTDPDALTEDQLDLIENEFVPDFIDTMIEKFERAETLSAERMELLDALKAVSPTEEPDTEEPADTQTPEEEPADTQTPEEEPDTEESEIEDVPDSVPIAEEHVSDLHESTALASQKHPDVDNVELDLSETAQRVASVAQRLAVKLMKRSTDQHFTTEDGVQVRLGLMLGDGTGSGKTITGLTFILDQISNGNKHHILIGSKDSHYYTNYQNDMKMLGVPSARCSISRTIKRVNVPQKKE